MGMRSSYTRQPTFDAWQMWSNSEERPSEISIIEVGTIPAFSSFSMISRRASGFSWRSIRYSLPANCGSKSRCPAEAIFSRSSNCRPIYADPRSPDTHIRSVSLAPDRYTILSLGASPMTVIEITSPAREEVVSPPTRSTP